MDIFIYGEPLVEYEVLDKVTAFWNFGADEFGRNSLNDVVRTMINRVRKKNKNFDKKGGDTADGIIIDDNNNGVIIRYRKPNNAATEIKEAQDEAPTPKLSTLQKKIQLQQTLSVGSTVLFDLYSRAYQGTIIEVRGNYLTIEYKDERGKIKTTSRNIDKVEPQR